MGKRMVVAMGMGTGTGTGTGMVMVMVMVMDMGMGMGTGEELNNNLVISDMVLMPEGLVAVPALKRSVATVDPSGICI